MLRIQIVRTSVISLPLVFIAASVLALAQVGTNNTVLNANLASANELQMVPHIDAPIVQAIISGRPYLAATAFAAIQCGAEPVFADSDPLTFNIDPVDVSRKITPFTKAIIPVHIFGLPADMDPLLNLAKNHNLTIIEDSAQCFFGIY